MAYTMEDFERDYIKEHFKKLTPEEQQEALRSLPLKKWQELLGAWPSEARHELLRSLPPEERLAGLSPEQIEQYLHRLTTGRSATRKPRRKKQGGNGAARR